MPWAIVDTPTFFGSYIADSCIFDMEIRILTTKTYADRRTEGDFIRRMVQMSNDFPGGFRMNRASAIPDH